MEERVSQGRSSQAMRPPDMHAHSWATQSTCVPTLAQTFLYKINILPSVGKFWVLVFPIHPTN